MRFQHVRIAAFGKCLPERRVTSEELEERLTPLYQRFRLRTGRLELMTGIRERRFFDPGTRPSRIASNAGEAALAEAEREGFSRDSVGCLIHASVCRDFLEPATASVVHHNLGLPDACVVFDLSNACLGVLNGIVQIANMIELGHIETGLVVAGEDGGPLVEETLRDLLANDELTKKEFKLAFASLTIGAGGVAILVTRADRDDPTQRLLGGTTLSATEHNVLCQGDKEGSSGPLMNTDSEALLLAGNDLARRTFERFRVELEDLMPILDRVVTHQVGSAHRKLLLKSLELDATVDYPTFEFLGNIGSASLPLSLQLAVEDGFIQSGHTVGLLGIGSGLNSLMLGLRW